MTVKISEVTAVTRRFLTLLYRSRSGINVSEFRAAVISDPAGRRPGPSPTYAGISADRTGVTVTTIEQPFGANFMVLI